MLKETYLAKMKEISVKNPDAAFTVVTRSSRHLLSPSWNLLNDYKDGRIDWVQYTERFKREMDSDPCRKEMKRIWDLSQTKDVFLVCYEKPPMWIYYYILSLFSSKVFNFLRPLVTASASSANI
jgi:hypothetical protein